MGVVGLGLRVKPINGKSFDVWGCVTEEVVQGTKVYYCAAESFPESCVEEVYTEEV